MVGWGLVAVGALLALAAQIADPIPGPPLYDGVIVVEQYLWLDPPEGYPEGATGVTESIGVSGGTNDVVAVGTPELPPQAQLIGIEGSLRLPAGATSITVTITPIEPPGPQPPNGYIDGNVYRFVVTDQAGNPVVAALDASLSVVLRQADQTVLDATINRFDGVEWRPLETTPDLFSGVVTNVTEFGDLAVVAKGISPYQTQVLSSPNPVATPAPTSSSAAPGAASTSPSGGDGTSVPGLAVVVPVLLGACLILVIAVAVFGRRRGRGQDDQRPPRWGR